MENEWHSWKEEWQSSSVMCLQDILAFLQDTTTHCFVAHLTIGGSGPDVTTIVLFTYHSSSQGSLVFPTIRLFYGCFSPPPDNCQAHHLVWHKPRTHGLGAPQLIVKGTQMGFKTRQIFEIDNKDMFSTTSANVHNPKKSEKQVRSDKDASEFRFRFRGPVS